MDEVHAALLGKRVLVRSSMRPEGFDSWKNVWMGSDFNGAFAQYVVVPGSEVFPVADDCDWSDAELAAVAESCRWLGRAELLANPAFRARIFAGSIQTPHRFEQFCLIFPNFA